MTWEEVHEAIVSLIDDCAAVGSSEAAFRLGFRLETLATAAKVRGEAIDHRLAGDIKNAMRLEQMSELDIEIALSS